MYRSFNEQKYPCTIEVKVIWEDDWIIDQIKGLNVGHALYLARDNWETAKEIELIQKIV